MSNIKETIRQIRHDYAVDTDEPPMSAYCRVRERLETELYDERSSSVYFDSQLDDKLADTVMEMSAKYPDIPKVSETEVRIGAGSALPQIYAIAAAWPSRTIKTFKAINHIK